VSRSALTEKLFKTTLFRFCAVIGGIIPAFYLLLPIRPAELFLVSTLSALLVHTIVGLIMLRHLWRDSIESPRRMLVTTLGGIILIVWLFSCALVATGRYFEPSLVRALQNLKKHSRTR
jgi:hypothetical protein